MPKLADRLTDIKVKTAKPKEKPYKLAAGRGLHLLVKTDVSKHWKIRFRFDGKENTLAIGRYSKVSLANAEKKPKEIAELLRAIDGFRYYGLSRSDRERLNNAIS